jgi:glutamine amidotransferase PdxT
MTSEERCIELLSENIALVARIAELEAENESMKNGEYYLDALHYREDLERIRTAIIAGGETGTIVDTLWMASGTDTVVDFIDLTLNRR